MEGALDTALADCDRYLEDEYGVTIGCQIFAIGDIDVRGMTPEQVGKVIELYKSNPSATYIL